MIRPPAHTHNKNENNRKEEPGKKGGRGQWYFTGLYRRLESSRKQEGSSLQKLLVIIYESKHENYISFYETSVKIFNHYLSLIQYQFRNRFKIMFHKCLSSFHTYNSTFFKVIDEVYEWVHNL